MTRNTLNLNEFISIPISQELYFRLTKAVGSGVSSVIEEWGWNFLERNKDELDSTGDVFAEGIHWERLFLPSGAKLRVKYFSQYHEGEVVGDRLYQEGKEYRSVNQMVKEIRGSVNAWTVVEIKRPTDHGWIPAARLR